MTDYKKLVKALRCCIPNPPETCEGCTYDTGGECNVVRMMADAADAIVALGLDNEDYEHENRRLHGEIEALQADMKTYGKTAFDEGYAMGFAAGEDRAEKQMPKLGKWIDDEFTSKGRCSVCGEEWSWFDNCMETFKYCPNCGADMRKMEVQDG